MARGRLRNRIKKNTEARHARQDRKQEDRLKRKEDKVIAKGENKYNRKVGKVKARGLRQQSKLSTKTAKKLSKIYGDLDPEDVNRINQVQPYVGAMSEQLQEQGVELEDPNDPIEVSSKYVQLSPDMDDPIDEDVYNNAFIDQPEDFDSHFDWEKAKQAGKRALKGALGGVANEAVSYVSELEDKKKNGVRLTPDEEKILAAKGKAVDYGTGIATDYLGEMLKTWLPWILGIGIVILIVKRKS